MFTNQLPYFQEKRPDYGMSLGLIHIDKSFRTLGLCGEKCFILVKTFFADSDESNIKNNTIHDHHMYPVYEMYEYAKSWKTERQTMIASNNINYFKPKEIL